MFVDESYSPRVGDATERLARLMVAARTRLLTRVDAHALVAAAQAFAVSRLLLIVVTYVAMALHPSVWGHDHPSSPTFWDAWYQWDARWYVRVARSGYHWQDLSHWSSVAFFPLYPIIIFFTVTVIPVSTKLIAILISNAMFFGAMYALYRLVDREFNRELAKRTVFYISLFPTALFFFAGYSESPFLLWSVLCVSSMRRRHWVRAGIFGGLAAATRSQGLALMVPFAYELWSVYGTRWRGLIRGAWIGLIPSGWGILACFMQVQFDNPLLFVQIQRAWHRTMAWPWDGIWMTLIRINLNKIASVDVAHNILELSCVLGFAALIAAGWGKMPRSFSLYALASFATIILSPAILDNYYLPLMSSSRLLLALFPCFITLAMLGKNEMVDRMVTTLGPGLMAVFTIVFLQGAWVA